LYCQLSETLVETILPFSTRYVSLWPEIAPGFSISRYSEGKVLQKLLKRAGRQHPADSVR
jgi:hypothetical protein